MKRGQDDEKIMGPMFPRLHVNDTEKGGPRAPPRNKMALYEQLSIPSQRFNHGVVPLNPSNSSNNSVPARSSSQRSGLCPPPHVPPPMPTHVAAKVHSRQHDGVKLNTSLAELEQRKKGGDEDDFRVPVFVHSGKGQYHGKTQDSIDGEKLTPFNPNHLDRTVKIQNIGDNDPKHISSSGLNLRRNVRDESEVNQEVCVSSRDHPVKSSPKVATRGRIGGPQEEADVSSNQQCQDHPMANFNRLQKNDAWLQQEPTIVLETNNSRLGDGVSELTRQVEKGNVPQHRSDSHLREDNSSPNETKIDRTFHGGRTCGPPKMGDGDKSDEVSESSMVDSISALDISPDDVVGIIGQKNFWKARRAILNQQRVFAVQVFELHRLIKVQQLIAGSPHLLLEDSNYLSTHSMNTSPAKKLPLESVALPSANVAKCKDDSEKPNHKMECSAENAVGKKSFSSVKNSNQPSNYGPSLENPTLVPMATDNKMGPWCFHQSLGHQWLMPLMSPSEGLVYKPYATPGFMGSVCSGCGPFGLPSLAVNFMNQACGFPASPRHQGIGVLPGAPLVGHGYFPSYGMPVMQPAISGSAVEEMNYFAVSGSHGQTGQFSGGGANFNMQHQSLCNLPTPKNGATPQVKKFQVSKDTEPQGSTASSPSERVQGDGTVQAAEGRDALRLFPVASAASEGAPQPQEADLPTRVIKVVPHNPRSATESAARIFQSIQEERKQYDSI